MPSPPRSGANDDPFVRWPKGYVGVGHETVGSDILAVLRTLLLPESILGEETVKRLNQVKPDDWYPIGWLLELMEELEHHVGAYALRRMGRHLFQLSHEARVRKVAHSARDIVYGIEDMYRHANRGEAIGGWQVLSFAPGRAELEKTTPHHCVMEEGILLGAMAAMMIPAVIEQPRCFRRGASSCTFVITSSVVDRRWTGSQTGST
jgi:hypothetical protein